MRLPLQAAAAAIPLLSFLRPRHRIPAMSAGVSWEFRKELPRQVEEAGVAALDGRLYVAGGDGPDGAVYADLWRYDPANDSWEELPPLPQPLNHPATIGCNGKLYAFGGHPHPAGMVSSNKTCIFDPKANRWETGADMPTPRGAAGIAVLGGKIYVVGGRNTGYPLSGGIAPALNVVEAYDPAADAWERKAPMNIARDHVIVEELGGKLYAVGGRSYTLLNTMNAAEAYDPKAGRWAVTQPAPVPISGLNAMKFNGKMLFPGTVSGAFLLPDFLAYSPRRGWSNLGPVPKPGYGYGCAVIDGVGYAVGGGPTLLNRFSSLVRAVRLKGV